MSLVTKVDQTAADGKKKQAAAPHTYSRGRNQTAAGQKKDQAAAYGQKKSAAAPHTSSCWGWKLPLATHKKWAAAPHASLRGVSQTAAGQKEDQAATDGQ